ncbi:MAG TPA: hypothetical protein ENJ82_02395 [Bacteroidetes bacterium]|nr:hypothetical protein [Bacteroidota bacterium]
MVAHYDLENLDMVDHGVRAAKIALSRKKSAAPETIYFRAVYKMFSDLIRASRIEKRKKAFSLFLAHFEKDSSPLWESMNNYFDLKTWVKSKLEKKSFQEMLE